MCTIHSKKMTLAALLLCLFSKVYYLTVWSTNLLSTCSPASPRQKSITDKQTICQLCCFVMSRHHALSKFVHQAVDIMVWQYCRLWYKFAGHNNSLMNAKDFQQLFANSLLFSLFKTKSVPSISTVKCYSKFVSFWVWYIYYWTAHIW